MSFSLGDGIATQGDVDELDHVESGQCGTRSLKFSVTWLGTAEVHPSHYSDIDAVHTPRSDDEWRATEAGP
jgi:hypothetical protein